MSRSARLGIAISLALVAVALAGITIFQMRQEISLLASDVTYWQNEANRAWARQNEFENALYDPAFEGTVDALVAEPDEGERQVILNRFLGGVDGLLAPFPLGHEVATRLTAIADAPTESARETVRDQLTTYIFEDKLSEPIVEAVVVGEEFATKVSTLATAAGAIVSSGMSLLAFLTSGGKRRLEDDMLALDVEMRRIEVARARHAAHQELGTQDLS